MDEHQHHEELVNGLFNQLKTLFENSSQAIYIYLDDSHKKCNKKFASLLGYKSSSEIDNIEDSFLDTLVSKGSQKLLATTYRNAMEKLIGSTIKVTFKKKGKGEVKTTVILVPIVYNNHLFALHFISQ